MLSAVIGIAIGIKGGWKRGSTFDRTSAPAITLTLYAMPEFWLGMVLLILFSTGVGIFPGIFPSGGTITPGLDPWSSTGIRDQAWHLVPARALTLTLAYLAEYALVMRSSLVDELGQDYLHDGARQGDDGQAGTPPARGARTRCCRPSRWSSSTSASSSPARSRSRRCSPGRASDCSAYQALRGPDVPLLQAIFLLFSLAVVVANIVADIVVAAVDPRVRT